MRTELIALLACASCRGEPSPSSGIETSSPTLAPAKQVPTTPPLAGKEFFRVDAATEQPACRVAAPCEAQVILTALGDYHVNENYPFKLVAEPTPGLQVEGTGTFSPKGKTGTMSLPFRATAAGTARIAGTFKLSVCNADNCQIEQPKIAFEIAVRPSS